MASSTADLVSLTLWQSLFGGIGLAALFYTLYLTRKSTKAASSAAEAAERAVDVTSNTAERQLRAYVCIREAKVEWENNRVVRAVITTKNTGQTPARNVVTWTTISIGQQTVFSRPTDIEGGSKSTVGSNGDYLLQARTAPLDDEIWQQIRNRRTPLWVWGELSYDDIFGKEQRTTRFRLLLHDKDDLLHSVYDGNETT